SSALRASHWPAPTTTSRPCVWTAIGRSTVRSVTKNHLESRMRGNVHVRFGVGVKVRFLGLHHTNDATFVYKNMYRHSSWAAMLLSRLQPTTQVMTRDGCLQLAIDDAEYHRAKAIVDEVFGEENFLG